MLLPSRVREHGQGPREQGRPSSQAGLCRGWWCCRGAWCLWGAGGVPVPTVGQGAGCMAAAAQVLVLAASLQAAGLPVLLSTSSLGDQPSGCLGQPWGSSGRCPAEARLFAGAQQEQAAGADTAGDTAPFPACPHAQDSAATLVPRVPGFSKPFSGCWRPSAPGNPGGCTQTLGLRCSGMPAGRAACGGAAQRSSPAASPELRAGSWGCAG